MAQIRRVLLTIEEKEIIRLFGCKDLRVRLLEYSMKGIMIDFS